MSLPLISVMLVGFLAAAPLRSDLGARFTVLIHPFAEQYFETEGVVSSGTFVHVRLPASAEEYVEVLHKGDRVLVIGSIGRLVCALGGDGVCNSAPLVDATRVERLETLKAISNPAHPLHPKGRISGRLKVREMNCASWIPLGVGDSMEA